MISRIDIPTEKNISSELSAAASRDSKQLASAAAQFESIFVGMMMKAMRGTVSGMGGDEEGPVKKSVGENMYTGMLDEEYSKAVSGSGKLGFAEMIVRQVSSMQGDDAEEALSQLTELRNMAAARGIDSSYETMPADRTAVFRGKTADLGTYNNEINAAAEEFGVDSDLIKAVITRESAGNQYAKSGAGAKGLMQLMDSTASDMGVDNVYNARENIRGGTKYLAKMLAQFGGDEKLALASYNAGPGAVIRHGGIPPYRETRDYVRNVMSTRDALRSQSAQ